MAGTVGHISRYELGSVRCEVGPGEITSESLEEKGQVLFRYTMPIRWFRHVDGEWHQTTYRQLIDSKLHNHFEE